MSHQVFIKNLEGPSYTFKVDLKAERVKDLIQKYASVVEEQEGKSAQLIFAGRHLNTEKYRGQLLSELSIMNGSTLYVALNLKGGNPMKLKILGVNKQQYEIEIDDNLTGYELKQYFYNNQSDSLEPQLMALIYEGVQIQNDKKLSAYKIAQQKGLVEIFQQKCSLGKIDGITLANEEDPLSCESQTVRIPCGHVFGRDGITQFIRALISCQKYNVKCPAQNQNGQECEYELQFSLCKKVGVLTKEQIHEFQEGLSINWLKEQTSPCPRCRFRVMKGELKSNKIVCPKCKYGDYCFRCWRKSGREICECKQINKILSQCEWNKTFDLKSEGKIETFYLPQFRACPNENCHQLINHSVGCKRMNCSKCKKSFCWVCLEIKQKNTWKCGPHKDYCGKTAPTQQFQSDYD